VKTDKNLTAIAVSIALILGILFFDAIYGTYGELKIGDKKEGVFRTLVLTTKDPEKFARLLEGGMK
jgi:hypothetical protein